MRSNINFLKLVGFVSDPDPRKFFQKDLDLYDIPGSADPLTLVLTLLRNRKPLNN